MESMPQELEVWYVLPKIRAELAKSMVRDYGLAQNKTAELLQLTKAAVSQYINDKRAGKKGDKEIIFNEKLKDQIKLSAKKIIENPNLLLSQVLFICNLFKQEGLLCQLHKKGQSNQLSYKNCKVCLR